ncbi:MAG: PspC domain-containing protein [Bacteroidales bacterium]|jgi:phage shock protein PspC (stress-responsive transcriptional regulator)|nr:PspC domain-containing protein [Bacteroidales bacterium]
MKKVVNVGIGGKSFAIDEDAYRRMNDYLEKFKSCTKMGVQTKEVMDDLEERIAELFSAKIDTFKDVVDLKLVTEVIAQLGMPDGSSYQFDDSSNYRSGNYDDSFEYKEIHPEHKLFRDPDDKAIGGVCSGLAAYLNIDVTLIRVIFVVLMLAGSTGLWIYIILWIVMPLAQTPAQKCEMHGIPVTAENMRRFSRK